jgi:hypothetical protein
MKPSDPLAVKLAAAFLSHLLNKDSVDACICLLPKPLPEFWLKLSAELRKETERAKELKP